MAARAFMHSALTPLRQNHFPGKLMKFHTLPRYLLIFAIRGDPKLIGLGFSVFVTIIIVELFGSPLMRSASVVFGLAVGCTISGAAGYWSRTNIDAAPVATFLWVHTFKLSVDGALVLPLLILFICEAVSCMPDILATAEISGVEIDGVEFNSRIQGGILCDGVGSLISALGTGMPMVSQAGNNGVISLTGCAVCFLPDTLPVLSDANTSLKYRAEEQDGALQDS
jgi:xanthine/uracil permease